MPPRLNTSNPEVISYFTEVCLYWLREAGVHGWRFDTANEVDPDFWRYLRKAVKREFPDALLMGGNLARRQPLAARRSI